MTVLPHKITSPDGARLDEKLSRVSGAVSSSTYVDCAQCYHNPGAGAVINVVSGADKMTFDELSTRGHLDMLPCTGPSFAGNYRSRDVYVLLNMKITSDCRATATAGTLRSSIVVLLHSRAEVNKTPLSIVRTCNIALNLPFRSYATQYSCAIPPIAETNALLGRSDSLRSISRH